MPPQQQNKSPTPASTIGISDIYYTIFRHKWKILSCSLLGLLGAAVYYFTFKPAFQSEAKLFIRYVETEGRAAGPIADGSNTKSPDLRGETIMQSEEQILRSMDLAKRVAESIGPEKILAKIDGTKDLNKATLIVSQGLTVVTARYSSVIQIVFQHPDPEIVQPVLKELVDSYLKLHVEIHRAVGIIGDFLTQETDQLRNRLAQTEDELRKAKNKAGVINVEDSKKSFSQEITRIRDELFTAQVQLAEKISLLEETKKNAQSPASSTPERGTNETDRTEGFPPPPPPHPPAEVIANFRQIITSLEALNKKEQELLLEFRAKTRV